LTIDSIGNLPAGICWVSNSPDNTFAGGQNGLIYLEGQTYGSAGQYKMQVFIHATTSVTTIPFSTLESVAGLRYYLRVTCPGGACEAVDTVGGKDSLFIPYSQVCGVGIHEVNTGIAELSISPNPFTSSAIVSFNSEREGTFVLRIYDLPGHVISAREVKAVYGTNELSIDRNGLSSGIYVLSISDGVSSVNNKLIIE
jgi:hypothetical protein